MARVQENLEVAGSAGEVMLQPRSAAALLFNRPDRANVDQRDECGTGRAKRILVQKEAVYPRIRDPR